MSRKALLFAAVVVVLVATFAAPVATTPLNGQVVVPGRLGGWLETGVGSPAMPVPIMLAGDCEGGAGGGCPACG